MFLFKLIFYGILDLTIDFCFIFMNDIQNIILSQGILLLQILLSCRISITFSETFFFFVTLHCFSGCKHYCVTLGCVNSSSCSLPFVQRASTRTACWKSAKILLWELDTSWKTPAFLLWGGGSAQHPRSLQALFPSPNVLFGTGHVPPPTLEQCLLHFIETINRISYKG